MPASRATCLDKHHSIYFLRCPYTNRVMYVGTSINPRTRFSNHLAYAKRFGRSHRVDGTTGWIYGLLLAGKKPMLQVVLSGLSLDCAYGVEKRLIEKHRKLGSRLRQTHFNSKRSKTIVEFSL